MSEIKQKSNYAIQMSAIKKDFIPTDKELKTINTYMFAKAIINHPVGALLARRIDESEIVIPQKALYWWVRSLFHNMKYINSYSIPSKVNPVLDFLCNHYKCSMEVAEDYYKILGDDGVAELQSLYKQGIVKKININ